MTKKSYDKIVKPVEVLAKRQPGLPRSARDYFTVDVWELESIQNRGFILNPRRLEGMTDSMEGDRHKVKDGQTPCDAIPLQMSFT